MGYVIYRRKPPNSTAVLVSTFKPMSEADAISTVQGLNKLENRKKSSQRNAYGYVHQSKVSSFIGKLQEGAA